MPQNVMTEPMKMRVTGLYLVANLWQFWIYDTLSPNGILAATLDPNLKDEVQINAWIGRQCQVVSARVDNMTRPLLIRKGRR